MKTQMILLLAVLGASACASNRPSDADRLAMYEAHAGAPVKQIRNVNAMGWERVDDQHVILSTRPTESWLLEVSGPCLDWGSGSPLLRLSSTGPYVMAKFDRILTEGSPVSCRIEEIRPIDVKAVRAAQDAARAQPSAGT
ncbi:DUF6491 family protein [Thermomonas sp.]|jgi:hypothetical protein|uniref:DUF6491 family protein n=2 Tax=Thermomonas sp. TaxID=1971895 RepID=UPI001B53043F|nr:DUF6491 family protein [Thermomonas sp.]MBK6333080.1 hypothetical protein [Thermomonas sp.]MBK6924073.1 hypothetical protein [Thermomonas sp.]MBK7205035.1 hypothetical protein [Thermomonas sp.]MBK9669748.1 hypothetical protein [Thermomonas sp.]MBL0227299.1 hypothetical protein [Thermomonas sp.]